MSTFRPYKISVAARVSCTNYTRRDRHASHLATHESLARPANCKIRLNIIWPGCGRGVCVLRAANELYTQCMPHERGSHFYSLRRRDRNRQTHASAELRRWRVLCEPRYILCLLVGDKHTVEIVVCSLVGNALRVVVEHLS